ncbi:UDP-3-O-[3-hydroxymyristoyl] N-acetylglucosamine deacetylase [Marinicauda salina]|uniref:UDP-3-O-acyl-N-acetylglucosamine deacetylase n=1 Tax=Marinicauda salina TaxID=2135793 RepID=A0A2U2BUN3_9PROT|nr:UDP-3-O-acyl-N-acetylglucosamine deacetylase [Marinicauda salina]PWE17712.1 UDP-3-O-[3-hydroxymyristoyl] N-acetylglucosamine deacetylase [Marinicauda salina]
MGERTTLASAAVCAGIGLHTGARVRMALKPAPSGSGIVFFRNDVDIDSARIPARHDLVTSTELGTTVTNAAGASVSTVEHLMAALAGLGVDDLVVELDGPEIPAMDGSSRPFVDLILRAGLKTHPAARRAIQVLKPVTIELDGRRAAFLPSLKPAIDVEIDFADSAIGRQSYAFEVSREAFVDAVAPARTFGFRRDVDAMMKAGLARGGSMDNAVVVEDDGGVANPEGLRFADEFVRHKALDALGDLYLAGGPLLALYRAERPGHGLNNAAVRALMADAEAWRMVSLAEIEVEPGRAARS